MMRLFILALAFFATGCATTSGVSSSFSSAEDTKNIQEKEQRLWSQAYDYDRSLNLSGQVYNNPRIQGYLQGVMDRLYPEFKGKIRVKMLNSTQLNAMALANGSVYFNIGLLSRIDNEAQLATVLAHEAVHFINKHSFKERVRVKNASAFAASGLPLSNLIAVSSVSGYSRSTESEADNEGYKRLVKAGYDTRESHKVFKYLADEIKALDVEEPYFFSSHPKLVNRIENFKALSRNSKRGGRKGYKTYNRIMRPLRLQVLKNELGQDRYKSIILVLTEKRAAGLYPAASQYYLGEAYRRRGEKGDDRRALKAFEAAEKRAPGFAPTYKILGVHYMKHKNKSKARYYFNRYLAVAPKNARDRAYIKSYISSL